ncbi:MAG: HepT-like ribonuclease domain-containing protein [Campylobacterota bacterium]|nr:HepT-like ribonuclease domain-containing protein [Campylobacterota bacterium]
MFSSRNLIHILTILEAIEKIDFYTKEFEDEEHFYYANKQLNFNATLNLLIAIGEENKKIDDGLKTSSLVHWKNVSALRDKISHNYRGIDEGIIWDSVQNYLPSLKSALIEMIPRIENFESILDEALASQYYEDLNYLKRVINE